MEKDLKRGQTVLHVGAQKTASTLLQRTLMRDEDVLRAAGVDVISRNRMRGTDFAKVVNKCCAGQLVADDELAAGRDALQDMFSPGATTHILSNEDLFNRIRIGYFFDHVDRGLNTMCHILGAPPRIILYVRSQPSYLESLYLQLIHVGKDVDFDTYAKALQDKLSWLGLAKKIVGYVGKENLTVVPFESLRHSDASSYYQRFLDLCGVPNARDFTISEAEAQSRGANRSFSAVAVDMARQCYPLLEDNDRMKFRRFLQENFSTATHPKALLQSADQVRGMLDAYAEENTRLFEDFMPSDMECIQYYR